MPKGLKRTLIVALIGLALYSLLGFLVLPGVALHLINGQLQQYVNGPARLERLEFNPFSLEAQAFGLSLGEPEQLGFQRLYLDLEWRSLWQRRLYLADMEVEGLSGEALFSADGTFNLQQLFEQPAEPQEPADDRSGQLFPLQIDRFALSRGYLRFRDERTEEPIELVYDNLDLELRQLSTAPDRQADAQLVARGPGGGELRWEGQLSLDPLGSEGDLQLDALQLKSLWPYAERSVPLRLQQGALDFATHYRLEFADETRLTLSDTRLKLSPLALDSQAGDPLLRVAGLQIEDTSLDLSEQRVTLGRIVVDGLETWLARGQDGQLNWQRLFADAAGESTPDDAEQTPPWRIRVNDGRLNGARLHLADAVPEQPVALELGPLNLQVERFDSAGEQPFALSLDTGVGRQGQVRAQGELSVEPPGGQLQLNLEDIDLRVAQAYLTPYAKVELRSGLLSSALQVELQGTEPLAFVVSGQAQVDQLHTLDTIRSRDLLRWQRLGLNDLRYEHDRLLSVGRVELDRPYARFIINPDQSTNLGELLVEPPDGEAAAAAQEEAKGELALHIGEIVLQEGSGDFADLSLRPPFGTNIEQLSGRIGTLDNRQASAAPVKIAGRVDRYAPVSIEGSLTPFDPLQSLDLATRFQQVELTTLSPYSSKFAGYRIQRGRMNLDLHYRVQQGQLDAQNKVVVEQLQLGEKVDSPDAVDLPVRLAVALLKDSHGVISLELPVRGDLNNPQFDVMPVVWQTLRNLVVRAAKAPFRMLGSLVAGDQPDLGEVPFAPGTSQLDEAARHRLDVLAKALQERPALRLEVEGRSLPRLDGSFIARQRLEDEYRRLWYRTLQNRGERVPADPAQLMVPEEEKAALLEGIYRTRLKRQPPQEWTELDDTERATRLRDAVVESWSDNSALLDRLSQARANSIKDYLVDAGGLAAERIYLLATSQADNAQEERVTARLHLGAL
ncbi:DUF748 domain-containing protein [Stutzerimonas azotifigens]|uniref:DUF748 domain-containing protein n=1 Tax=Stutzerimonas azotifigens TaxID=291995 RepID=UPI0004212D8A|nr:DUF748 domain-containing protein [Stutzerimonas azotifigens]